jgi:hypothetical protein
MVKENKPIDWAGIESDYRDGRMSVRDIAKWYGISHTAINKKAKADGWQRKQQPPHVDRRQAIITDVLRPSSMKPEELPDRARGIAARLLDELDSSTAHAGELEDMICAEESDPRRRQALLKAISTGERAMTLKNITQAMKTINEASAPQGKKQERQDAAEKVAGKFGVRAAPKLAVDNTR